MAVVRKIFIVAPSNCVSGGPELCHQLGDVLNRAGERAFMLYLPFTWPDRLPGQRWEVPLCYQKYHVRSATAEDVEPGSVVIFPEAAVQAVDRFPGTETFFWWLSVDGFFRAAELRGSDFEDDLNVLRRCVDKHLYQSEYAREFLEAEGLGPAHRLSDRLSNIYLDNLSVVQVPRERRDLVVYNPAKGMPRTQLILDVLAQRDNAPEVAAVTRMWPHQVKELLEQAKVYIDFGPHPGKDRLPREAAVCGARVVVNRRGSAGNMVDVPIPDMFKIDDTKPGFEDAAADLVMALLGDFDKHQKWFNYYRVVIALESAGFIDDIAALFPREV